MKIAVISDTHGKIRPQVAERVSECEAVIHAGDIHTERTLDTLKSCMKENAPIYIVRGNCDGEWADKLPETLEFEIEGVTFSLIHNKAQLPKHMEQNQIIIYGHSHKYVEVEVNGQLWLNPGSCGPKRFDKAVTMAILTLEDGAWRVERVDIPD